MRLDWHARWTEVSGKHQSWRREEMRETRGMRESESREKRALKGGGTGGLGDDGTCDRRDRAHRGEGMECKVEIRSVMRDLISGRSLGQRRAAAVMELIMSGGATPAQIGGFVTALRMKGETVDEITGCARVMREQAVPISPGGSLVDTCGTGGDGSGTFNISTTAAFVVAGAGFRVAKHGNRSVSSRSGSADLLEELGVEIGLSPRSVVRCLDEIGIGFMYAPVFHRAMKHAIGPRRELGVRTVFNILGPLTNPAGATSQVLGVYSPELTEPLAGVLRNLGVESAYVVHGAGGLDELSTLGETRVTALRGGRIFNLTVTPEDFGLSRTGLESVKGGDAGANAAITRKVLAGSAGPEREITVLNAGAAIAVAGGADDIAGGVRVAEEALDSGAARSKLEALIRLSGELARVEGENRAG